MLWDTPDSLLDEEVIKKPAELDDASYEALVRAEFHGVHVGNEHDVRGLVRLLGVILFSMREVTVAIKG